MSKHLQGVGFHRVRFEDAFWNPAIRRLAEDTLPYCIEKCRETPRIRNFERCAQAMKNGTIGQGGHEGIYFDDSDLYKILEGAAYVLHCFPDATLKRETDAIIEKIAACQWEDGYINTYYTLNAPDERWTDMGKHEAYCIGHMIEAGVAYFHATGDRKFLDVCIRAAEHMENIFGPGKRVWVVGHQELELALVKLYRVTGNRTHLEFADWLLAQRGHGYSVDHSCDVPVFGLTIMQEDKPLAEVTRVTGHAVRMMYYMSGAADVAAETGNQTYADAVQRVWDNVCGKNMYVTGGIGPNHKNEGFLDDYFLPIDDNYCETCAQIGMVYFNHRMNLMTGLAKYADIVELELYNGVLSGLAYDGKHFFYANPMQSDGDKARSEWFRCSCCPSNLCRFIPSVGEYFYATAPGTLLINQFASGTAELEVDGSPVRITQQTAYPYDGRVTLHISTSKPVTVKLRMPGWCRSAEITGADAALDTDGYWSFTCSGDADIIYAMDMSVRIVTANPACKEVAGMGVLARGPIVYCAEQADNPGIEAPELSLSRAPAARIIRSDLLGGVTLLNVDGRFTALPYFAWNNRGPGWMRTYLPLEDHSHILYEGHTRL